MAPVSTEAADQRTGDDDGHQRADGRETVGERARGPLDPILRIGWAIKGVVYGVIGVLALQVAFGNSNQDADEEGALEALASQPMGQVLLWMVAAGMLFYAGGRIAEALLVATDRPWHHRIVIGASGAIHGSIALVAARFALGAGGGSDNEEEVLTARALELPAGQWLVGIGGLAVIAAGGALVWGALSKRYVDELDLDRADGRMGDVIVWTGFVGVAARGAAVSLLGWFLLHAALQDDPDEAAGLDEALRQLGDAPFGQAALALLALGFVAFGLTCLAHARYRRS